MAFSLNYAGAQRHSPGEQLLLDSGAECCVCPAHYAPECEVIPLQPGEGPDLVTVTGDPMPVYGSKYVHYTFPKGRWMVVRYWVCDAPYPVLSVAGLCRSGYDVSFGLADRARVVRPSATVIAEHALS